jgi:hypothetical protein
VPAVEAHRFAAEPSAANVAISVAGRCRSGSRAVAVNSMICPTGSRSKTLSSPLGKNILPTYSVNQKYGIPPGHEGRIAIVTTREAGMRWTHWRRARSFVRTNGAEADDEVVWSWPPDAEA